MDNWKLNILIVLLISIINPLFVFAEDEDKERKSYEWAWEAEDPDEEKYPITRHYFWLSPSLFIAGGVTYSYYTADDDETSDGYSLGFIFRPIVFNMEESKTLSVGIVGLGFWEYTDGEELRDVEDILGTQIAVVDANSDTTTFTYSIGASFFYSSPGDGVQISADIGYYWSRFYFKTEDFPIIDNLLDTTFRQEQYEEGIFFFFKFSYLADRLFLYGIESTLSLSIPISQDIDTEIFDNILTNTRIDLNEDEIDTLTFTNLNFVRAFAVEVFKDGRITVEPALGFGHSQTNDGLSVFIGARLNIFEIIGISILQDFETNNDAEDRLVINLEVGFGFGQRLNSTDRVLLNF